jgi:hypothetical protein
MSEGESGHAGPRRRLARWLAWICNRERIAVIFAGGLFLIAYLQWRTLEKTDLTLKAEQRPWVQSDVPAKRGLSWAGTEISGLMTFRLINSGHSPALNVRAFSNTLLVWDDERARKVQDLLCDAFHSGLDEWGVTLFPNNRPYEQFVTIDVLADEIEKFKANPPPFPRPIVVGCVTYFYYADHSPHDTGFMYLIRPNPAQLPFVLPKPGEVIPPEKYDLVPYGTSRVN